MIDYTPYYDQALLRAIVLPEGGAEAFTVRYGHYATALYHNVRQLVKDSIVA